MNGFDPLHAPALELEMDLAYGHVPVPQLLPAPVAVPGCTGKQGYADNASVRTAINRREQRGSEPLRAYRCEACCLWHMARVRGQQQRGRVRPAA